MDLRELIAAVNNDIGNLQSGVQSRELRNVDLLYQCDHVEPPVEEEKAAAAVSDEDLLKKKLLAYMTIAETLSSSHWNLVRADVASSPACRRVPKGGGAAE
ncbi:hypothetical protein GUITHDRAFT_116810 [Guillardia theta CCMP2712]|uniref:Uncharacterized protein n=1 Tax=Guillardia theta (strain CCMP2712) TaxID=905079 RepID=L1IL11_GUITC|nr:hypothetical protein GUITHDRAFT_116810 [Guillardia theta CCMP2712]EKX36943.1 hypothetical protein GUITHDRAFT_116810 [Guillardia theta CCMP2712]|eukprot:XP_005823923.1 hypothetical protein GUITHDRAFT_116810 [Guillardia theta CCMP2712]